MTYVHTLTFISLVFKMFLHVMDMNMSSFMYLFIALYVFLFV